MFRTLSYALSWVVLTSLSVPAAMAQDVATKSGAAEATAAQRALVRQLGDDSVQTREKAAEKLSSQGLSAKAALMEALKDPDAEIRGRARIILKRMLAEVTAEDTAVQSDIAEATAAQRELVQHLGDPSFQVREGAQKKLASLGLAPEAALLEALKDPDLEIRWRAGRILDRARVKAFEARLEAFIADADGSPQLSLLGWKQFRDLVGDRRDTREMFAEMTRYEGALLSAYEKRSPELPELFAARVTWLQSKAPPRASLATLLLIGCDKTVKDHSQSISKVYILLCQGAAVQSIGTEGQPLVLRTLLEKWTTSAGSVSSYYSIALTLKYNLKEAAMKQATALLKSGTNSSSLRYAVIAVGRFGGEEHAALLTPLLKNKTVCGRWRNSALKKEGTIDTQLRDVTLVVLLRFSGKDPKEYGFKLLVENPETLYHSYTFGFVEDKDREAVHAKWVADSKADTK
jgi:hypothetical protein